MLVRLLRRFAHLVDRRRFERELDEEVQLHVDLRAAELRKSGMPEREAQQKARRDFGNAVRLKESSRETWVWRWLETSLQDLRYGWRTLLRSPGFTAVAVLSLSLGIGINTAVFSLMDAVLLKMLPVNDPGQLVVLSFGTNHRTDFSYPLYRDLRDGNSVLSGLVCQFTIPMDANISGQSERISGDLVSGNYFQVLGVNALIGRTLLPEDSRVAGAQPVVVLSNGYWKRRFGSDPGVVGKTIRLDGSPMVVVGVTPAGFEGTEIGASPDVRLPVTMVGKLPGVDSNLEARGWGWLDLIGRVKPGISHGQAQTALNVLYSRIRKEEFRGVFKNFPPELRSSLQGLSIEPGRRGTSALRKQFSRPMWILMGAVTMVLLIACANVANLLLARGTARGREIAVRLAVGASRARVVRQLVTESILLSVLAAGLGTWLARWGTRVLVSFLPEGRMPLVLHADLDSRALFFTLAISLATGIFFGLAPAWQITRPALSPALKVQAGSGVVRESRSLRRVLIVVQVALSFVLLAGAGLFVRTLRNLKALDLGFDRENILLVSLSPSLNGYSQEATEHFFEEVLAKVRALPGVRVASLGYMGLMGSNLTIQSVVSEGNRRLPGSGGWVNSISPQYLETLGIPVLLGRDFSAQDSATSPKVAIVNQTFAHHAYPDGSAIGRRLGFGDNGPADIQIVGVVRDGKYKSARDGKTPNLVYLPLVQTHESDLTLHVRTVGDPGFVTAAIRSEVQAVDKNVPAYNIKTLEAQFDESLSQERLVATLSTGLGSLALLLASIGLYGVMTYSVTRRTNEIGIRMAMGAPGGRVIWLVLREALLLVTLGVAIGIPLAMALGRSVASLLYGLEPGDPVTVSVSGIILVVVALGASYLPARRAARVDPVVALRCE